MTREQLQKETDKYDRRWTEDQRIRDTVHRYRPFPNFKKIKYEKEKKEKIRKGNVKNCLDIFKF